MINTNYEKINLSCFIHFEDISINIYLHYW